MLENTQNPWEKVVQIIQGQINSDSAWEPASAELLEHLGEHEIDWLDAAIDLSAAAEVVGDEEGPTTYLETTLN